MMIASVPILSRVIEGVEFTLGDHCRNAKALATRDLLETVFGADSTPESWLATYSLNAKVIRRAGEEMYRSRPLTDRRGAVVLSERQWIALTTRRLQSA